MKSELGPPPEESPEIELIALFNQDILLVDIFASFFIFFYKKLKNVSCEYNRLNG